MNPSRCARVGVTISEIARSARETAAAADSIQQAAEQTNRASVERTQLASDLQRMVERFRVDE